MSSSYFDDTATISLTEPAILDPIEHEQSTIKLNSSSASKMQKALLTYVPDTCSFENSVIEPTLNEY